MRHSQPGYPQPQNPQQPGQYPPQYLQGQPNGPAAQSSLFMGQFALGPGVFGVAVIPIQNLGFAGPGAPNPRPVPNTGQQQHVRKPHKRGVASTRRNKERRKARRAQEREAQGVQDSSAAPGNALDGSQAEGISASCPVCGDECPHRDGRLSCLHQLPDDLFQEVCRLIGEGKRSNADSLIRQFWERGVH